MIFFPYSLELEVLLLGFRLLYILLSIAFPSLNSLLAGISLLN